MEFKQEFILVQYKVHVTLLRAHEVSEVPLHVVLFICFDDKMFLKKKKNVPCQKQQD